MTTHLRQASHRPWLLTLLWAGAVSAVALLARRYWIPLDDGTLAQAAERVLGGELPHRDFGDPYTGLNAIVGAVALELFGMRLLSLRIPLVVGFGLWLPAVWLVVRRFFEPDVSLLVTALAALLSVLAYPAAMPTWFGLFAVTWGLVGLIRYGDEANRRWLMAVGAAVGVAVLFKVVGLYFLAAALVTVAWTRADGSRLYGFATLSGVGLFLLLLGAMLLPRTNVTGLVHFLVPSLFLGIALIAHAWRSRPGPDRGLRCLSSDVTVLLLGAAAPILVFLVPYMTTASVGAWAEGVFVLPARRFAAASSGPASLWTVATGVVAVAVMMLATKVTGAPARRWAIALGGLLTAGLVLDDRLDGAVLAAYWYSARTWIPILTVVASWQWLSRNVDHEHGGGSVACVAVVSTAALWSLVQFPYSSPAYFFYVAPLGVLATAGVWRGSGRRRPGPVLAVLATLYAFLGGGYVAGVATSGTTLLALERGGIRVPRDDAERYSRLTEAIRSHDRGGDIWAGPDAPEVYFLSGKPNRTPTIYEFLTPHFGTSEDLERFLDTRSVVVVNSRPLFSAPLSSEVQARLAQWFPQEEAIGPYIVRWRSE